MTNTNTQWRPSCHVCGCFVVMEAYDVFYDYYSGAYEEGYTACPKHGGPSPERVQEIRAEHAAVRAGGVTGQGEKEVLGDGHPSVAQVMRPVTPEPFGFHDLALDGVDFRDLPHEDRSWDTVCFDPPYVPRMGSLPASRLEDVAYRERYGLDTPRSHREVVALMFAGLSECARVAQHYVLVKCCDYVTSRRLYLSHVAVVSEGERLGLRVHDLLVHGAGRGPGDGQIRQVRRSRRAHSYLVVFSVPSRPASTRAALRPPSSAPGSGAGSHP